MLRAVDGVHTWTSPDGLTITLNELDDLSTGAPVWPRYRLLDVDHGYPEAGDTLHKRVGQAGAVSHPDYRGSRVHSYVIEVMGRNITELRQGEETLRAAFYDQSAEGRMDVGTHPLNPDYDADDDRYFNAKALSLQPGTNAPDSDLSPELGFRREWVLGLRNHSGVYVSESPAAFKDAIVDLGPSLYWALDDEDGLTDLSGNGRDGTAHGGVTVGGAAGLTSFAGDSATDFDGSDDYISSSYAPFVDGSILTFLFCWTPLVGPATIISGSGANPPIITGGTGALGTGFMVDPDASAGSTPPHVGPSGSGTTLIAVLMDTATTPGSTIKRVSKDGGSFTTSPGTEAANYGAAPGNLIVGARGSTPTNLFDGPLGHVAVFERALTVDEVASIYALLTTGQREYV